MSTTAESNYLDVLKDIEEFYTDNPVEVWCPVSGIELKFKPLSVEQLKALMELQMGTQKDVYGVVSGLEIINYFNKIITDNCLTEVPDLLDTLTTFDRDAIMVQLRAESKDSIDIVNEEKTVTVDLAAMVANLKDKKVTEKTKSRNRSYKYKVGNIALDLGLPTLAVDGLLNTHFQKEFKGKFKRDDVNKIRDDIEKVLTEVFFVEVCKYVKSITITKGGNKTVVVFDDLEKLPVSVKLLQKLPSRIVSDISDYVNAVKKSRDSLLSHNDVSVDVDANLFIGL